MATVGQAETPTNNTNSKVNNCDSSGINNSSGSSGSKLVNGSANDPDFSSPENNNAMKEGYRYNHAPPGPYDHHNRLNQNSHHPDQQQKGVVGGGMDGQQQQQEYPPPPPHQQQYQQYPPYRAQQSYDQQPPPHHNNGPESYQQHQQQQQQHPGYPQPMRYPGKPNKVTRSDKTK